MYGVCKVCGCTENDACFHPDFGMCWWVDDTHELCSHCADPDIANSPDVVHCVNSLEEKQYCDMCVHYDKEDCSCMLDGDCKFEDIDKQGPKSKMENNIPDKVSWRVVDAWAAIPPCDPASSHPYCHVQCPYFYECYPEEFDDEE